MKQTVVLLFFWFLMISAVCGQQTVGSDNSKKESDKVVLHRIFPSEKGADSTSLFDKVGELIFGKDMDVVPVKPISVFAKSPEAFWVLDQGIGSLLEINKLEGKIPKSFKHKYTSLVGLCATQDNELLFTDSGLDKILSFGLNDGKLSEWAENVELVQPTGIAYSPLTEEIWVVETAAHRISVLNSKGEFIRRIGKRGIEQGEFNYPTFIWIDKSGKIYIVDAMNFRIQILDSEGKVISLFGQAGDATGYFSRPKGIATDSSGNIYIVDALFNAVQIFDQKGNFLYTFGQQGREPGRFWMPTGIFIDDQDYIYISDSYNSRIQIFHFAEGKK